MNASHLSRVRRPSANRLIGHVTSTLHLAHEFAALGYSKVARTLLDEMLPSVRQDILPPAATTTFFLHLGELAAAQGEFEQRYVPLDPPAFAWSAWSKTCAAPSFIAMLSESGGRGPKTRRDHRINERYLECNGLGRWLMLTPYSRFFKRQRWEA